MNNEKKSISKKIICIIIVIMLCNFIVPNYIQAVDTGDGGSLMDVIMQFLCFIPDSVMSLLQNMFTNLESIEIEKDTYSIQYSPGVIFSGTVPAFDINFITPGDSKTDGNYIKQYIEENIDYFSLRALTIESDEYEEIMKAIREKQYDGVISGEDETIYDLNGKIYDIYYYIEDDMLITEYVEENGVKVGDDILVSSYRYGKLETPISNISTSGSTIDYESTAKILQPLISTWYNVFRKIALVVLLSVIVYIGIKIVLTSTSAKDKAKYKSMLKDWVIALCLLFTLHYIMSIIITIVDKVNEIIKVSSISSNGEDILMTNVRNTILNAENWSQAITYVVIYMVLVIYTIIFTIQYFRRTVYLAFLTMIAPLITVTYPLDKIKDSKAQAFDMWIKDYVFFSLIQVVHLLIYYIFLGTSIDLAQQGNWLFAIVAIGFITQAEKLVKKMFGFEKSKTLGAMGAGATGALIMNAMQKIPHGASKEGKASGQVATNKENSNYVRTATPNPFVNYNNGATSPQISLPDFPNVGGNQEDSSDNSNIPGNTKNNKKETSQKSDKLPRSTINGVMAIAKKYSRPLAAGTIKFTAKTTGALVGGATMIAKGEGGKIAQGGIIGGSVGEGIANTIVQVPKRLATIPEKFNEAIDTYREGAYGKEIAQNAKFDRVFRTSKEYTELREKSGFTERDFDRKIQQILDKGITDKKRITKILKNHKLDPKRYSMDKAIKYSNLAAKCSEDILYDKVKFIRFCQDMKLGLSEEELIELRKNIMNFR